MRCKTTAFTYLQYTVAMLHTPKICTTTQNQHHGLYNLLLLMKYCNTSVSNTLFCTEQCNENLVWKEWPTDVGNCLACILHAAPPGPPWQPVQWSPRLNAPHTHTHTSTHLPPPIDVYQVTHTPTYTLWNRRPLNFLGTHIKTPLRNEGVGITNNVRGLNFG